MYLLGFMAKWIVVKARLPQPVYIVTHIILILFIKFEFWGTGLLHAQSPIISLIW